MTTTPYRLPNDVARCNGQLEVAGSVIDCPMRSQCLRYLARNTTQERCVFITNPMAPRPRECELFLFVEST